MATSRNSKTYLLKEISLEKLTFSDKKETKNPKGTDNVFIGYGDDNQWLYVQFPAELRHPFEANINEDNSMTLTLSLDYNNAKHRAAIDKLRKFDDVIFDHLKSNSQALLKKSSIDDKFRESDKFTPFLRVKEKDGDPDVKYYNIKIKLPAKDKKITTVVYDSKMNIVDPSYITPRCTVKPIIRPARIWFQKLGKVGTTWECAHIIVKQNESENENSEIFKNESDDETDTAKPADDEETETDVTENDGGVHDASGEKSGDENETEEDDDREIVAPTTVAAKARGGKRNVIRKNA